MHNPFTIMKTVEKEYNLREGSLILKKRTQSLSDARAVAMYLIRTFTPYSYVEIGDCFEMDHTSVVHNLRKCRNIITAVNKGLTASINQKYIKETIEKVSKELI